MPFDTLYLTQRAFFRSAYQHGDERLQKGYGWPKDVSYDVKYFLKTLGRSQGSRILDIGCGEGRNAVFLGEKGFEVYGFDYAIEALRRAKALGVEQRAADKTHLLLADVINPPFRAEAFDAALDWGCFHHLRKREWRRYMENLLSLLKAQADFFLTIFSVNNVHLKNKRRRWVVHRGHYDRYFLKAEIKRIFSNHFNIHSIHELTIRGPQTTDRYYYCWMRRRKRRRED